MEEEIYHGRFFPILFISQLQKLDTQSDNQVQLSNRQKQKRTGNLLEMVEDLSLEKKGKYFRLKRIEKVTNKCVEVVLEAKNPKAIPHLSVFPRMASHRERHPTRKLPEANGGPTRCLPSISI